MDKETLGTLFYKELPQGYQEGEKCYAFAVELSGIQRFIFNVLDNSGSLRQIKQNSNTIVALTELIVSRMKEVYAFKEDEIMTQSSGKFYAIVKHDADIFAIEETLISLEKAVYLTYEGKLRLYYGMKEVKLSHTLDQETLHGYSELMQALQNARRQNTRVLDYSTEEPYEKLDTVLKKYSKAHNTDNLRTIDQITASHEGQNYITGLKLDFDNLGEFFASIRYSDEIKAISLELDKKIQEVLAKYRDIYIVFAGGDDIFMLVNFFDAFTIMSQLERDLKALFAPYKAHYPFGLSAGMITFKERTSIIYYGEQLERQLSYVKQHGKNGLSTDYRHYSWEEVHTMKTQIDAWLKQFKGYQEDYRSKLNAIERTTSLLLKAKDQEDIVTQFMLKIPHFEKRIKGIIPQELKTYHAGKTLEESVHQIARFHTTITYANRVLMKGRSV